MGLYGSAAPPSPSGGPENRIFVFVKNSKNYDGKQRRGRATTARLGRSHRALCVGAIFVKKGSISVMNEWF